MSYLDLFTVNASRDPLMDKHNNQKPDLVVAAYCPSCGKAHNGQFMFSFPVSLPHEELCMCGQLKSRNLSDTISFK